MQMSKNSSQEEHDMTRTILRLLRFTIGPFTTASLLLSQPAKVNVLQNTTMLHKVFNGGERPSFNTLAF